MVGPRFVVRHWPKWVTPALGSSGSSEVGRREPLIPLGGGNSVTRDGQALDHRRPCEGSRLDLGFALPQSAWTRYGPAQPRRACYPSATQPAEFPGHGVAPQRHSDPRKTRARGRSRMSTRARRNGCYWQIQNGLPAFTAIGLCRPSRGQPSRTRPSRGGVGGFGVALPSHRPDTPSRTRGGGMTEISGSQHAKPRSRDNPRPDARIAQLGETPRRGGCSGNLEACSRDRASRVARSGGDHEDGDGRSRQGLRPIS